MPSNAPDFEVWRSHVAMGRKRRWQFALDPVPRKHGQLYSAVHLCQSPHQRGVCLQAKAQAAGQVLRAGRAPCVTSAQLFTGSSQNLI
jgi:hypothetical protein